jgi:hypothetical protein
LQRLCAEYRYQLFPLVIDGELVGLIDRKKILTNQSSKIEADPAQAIAAHSTIREAVTMMVENCISLLVVRFTMSFDCKIDYTMRHHGSGRPGT